MKTIRKPSRAKYRHGPQFRNNTGYALVNQGDENYIENSSLLSLDTILGNRVNRFGPELGDPSRPSDIYFEAFVEEASFAHDGQDATPLPSAVALIEIDPAQESTWPSFTTLRPVFHQTLEHFHTYLRELLSQLGFGLGAQDHTTPTEIDFSDKTETVVEETSFAHDGQDATPLPSAEALIEIDPAQESAWPSFTTLRPVFHQTLERFHTYLRELLSQLGFGLGAQDHTTPTEIDFSDKTETVVEETSFAHDGQDATPLPSAEALIEIDPAQESAWPSFTTLRPVFHQTLERFHTYLRELLSQLGFGLGAQDHTTPTEIDLPDKTETVVEETSFAHDGQDATPLPSAEALIEIDPAQESAWPSFTTLRPVFHQTLERFHTYLRELLSQLGFGLGAQDHTTPTEIDLPDKTETVVEETSFAHDGQDATPLPSAEALIEIDPAQESAWPSFTTLRPVFHQTLERFHTYLRELLSQLGFGLGAQDHTTPTEIDFSDKTETVVEETSFAHDGQDATPLPSAEALIEIDPAQESAWPSFTTLKPVFHQTLERFHTYLRELLSQLGFGPGAQDHTTPTEIDLPDKTETVVEETSFAHDGQDATPLPSAEALIEIDPAQESAWPSFTTLRPVFHQTLERFHTYLRELLSQLGFGPGAQDHTTPTEIDFSDEPETAVEETSFAHDSQDATPLPSAEELIGSSSEEWQLNSALLEWSSQMLSIMASVEAVLIVGGVFISQCIVKYAFRRTEKKPDRVCRKPLEQQKPTQAALTQKPVEESKADKLEKAMERLMAYKGKMREIHQPKPPTRVTIEQQLQALDRDLVEWKRNVRAVESDMEEMGKMLSDWKADLSRIRFPSQVEL
ncbi:uncharacterized protein LOC118230829 isoform X3 [Anguilla anguilla]|uniref:uncharacterized protein LOC118230829 isoform X3 n=1 Tax=Anguilla anguilla TaxID=7936 RepID=UPI0015AB9278|nr:uncharacterized protein LOC118230829 isoform X3 [Anguilla anguilla]